MTFNQIMDLPFDRENPRTQNRQLVSGKVSTSLAWIFFGVNATLFIGVAWSLNALAFSLSLPCLAVLLFYSLTKRFTAFSHFFLGLALGLAPIGAWVAVRGSLDLTPLSLGLAVFFWVSGFDMIYATQDEEFDKKAGLQSAIVWLGKEKALWLARFSHLLVIPCLLWFASLTTVLGIFFYCACGVIFLLLFYEHALVRPQGDLQKVNQAFFKVNGIISILLLSATILDLSL